MELLQQVDAAGLTQYSRLLAADLDADTTKGPSLATFLPNRTIEGLESVITRVSRTLTTAQFRGWDARTPVGQRPIAVSKSKLELAPLGQMLPIREKEIVLKAIGDNEYGSLIDITYADARNNVASIRNRMEQLRAALLFTGIVTINENEFIQEADFGLAADHNLSAAQVGDLWSDEATDLIGMELAWKQKVLQDSDETPVATLTSQRVVNAMLAHPSYRLSGGSEAPINYSMAALNATRTAAGLPPVVVYDKVLHGERLTPDNKIAMITETFGETQWGDTADAIELFGSNAIDEETTDAPAIATSVWRTKNPTQVWTKSESTALPVVGDINGLLVAEVLAETPAS